MVDGRHFNAGSFQGSETPLNDHESLVAAGGIFQADGIVIGFNHPSAVIPGRFPDRSTVDADYAALCHFQVSLEAKGGKQINGPSSCGLRPGGKTGPKSAYKTQTEVKESVIEW